MGSWRCNLTILRNITSTVNMYDSLFWCSWCLTMSEDGEARFREPKPVYEERELVEKAIPYSAKYKNKWTVTIFGEWKISRSVTALVLKSKRAL